MVTGMPKSNSTPFLAPAYTPTPVSASPSRRLSTVCLRYVGLIDAVPSEGRRSLKLVNGSANVSFGNDAIVSFPIKPCSTDERHVHPAVPEPGSPFAMIPALEADCAFPSAPIQTEASFPAWTRATSERSLTCGAYAGHACAMRLESSANLRLSGRNAASEIDTDALAHTFPEMECSRASSRNALLADVTVAYCCTSIRTAANDASLELSARVRPSPYHGLYALSRGTSALDASNCT